MRHCRFTFFTTAALVLLSNFVATTAAAANIADDLSSTAVEARPLSPKELPAPLRSWLPWALKDQASRACPFAYNAVEDRRCVWPGNISLTVNAKGGSFSYQVQVFAPAMVALPGSAELT